MLKEIIIFILIVLLTILVLFLLQEFGNFEYVENYHIMNYSNFKEVYFLFLKI